MQMNKGMLRKAKLQRTHSALFKRPYSSIKQRIKQPITGTSFSNYNNSLFNISHNGTINNNNDSSFSFTAKLSSSLMDKEKLYAETLQLKTQVNQIKDEICLMKSEIRKKEEEILKKEKFIGLVSNDAKEPEIQSICKLKNQNEISKMKNSFKLLKKNLLMQKEENNKLTSEIKKQVISKLKQENENKYKELNSYVNQYINSIICNQQTEKKVQNMKNNIYVFNEKHLTIRRLQKEIELSKKKTQKINNDIYKVREEISVKENFIKKKTIENNNLQKQNEKLLAEKKERENYIFKKPVYEKKIKELEEKVDAYKKQESHNNVLINDLQKQNDELAKKNKELSSHIAKPMDYKLITFIEKNPNEEKNPKVMLLKSLIKESKKRQEELRKILNQYSNQ